MCGVDQQPPDRHEAQRHTMRWMLFAVVMVLALGTGATFVIHGPSLSPALGMPFLLLAWLMRRLFPAAQPSSRLVPLIVIWVGKSITRKASS
jgi:hypothetical protein